MTVKENNVANEELRIAKMERIMELIGEYNSAEEDKITDLPDID